MAIVQESALKLPFTILILVATIMTAFSMFTPGWRYTEATNEGVIVGHYGERLPWENWVMAFLIISFILELIVLIGAVGGFFRTATPGLLFGLTLMTLLPAILLVVVTIIYASNYNYPYDYTVVYGGRTLTPAEVATMYPFSRQAAYREIALGYSFYLAPLAIIPLVVAAILYLIPAIRRQREGIRRC